jgi:hypothetical protein
MTNGYTLPMASWKFFIGACILAAGLLIKAGVPIVPVAVGIAAAAILTWRRQRPRADMKR